MKNTRDQIAVAPRAIPATAVLAGGAVVFALLSAVSGLVRIPLPFTPVPVTLQVFVVLLAGAVLGRGWGAASQGLYVASGALGAPVFAGAAAGLAYIAGPTGGYLAGFVLAPFVVAAILGGRDQFTPLRVAGAMAAGVAVIHTCGWAWLAFGLHMGPGAAFFAGVHPFLPLDALKAAAAAALVLPFRRSVHGE